MDQEILWLGWTGLYLTPWKLIGLTGALMFGLRWLVQLIASHRAGRPVIPRLFWYMSLCGSLMALSYFLFSSKQDVVGVLQNLLPALTAAYSLVLDIRSAAGERNHSPRRSDPARDGMPRGRGQARSYNHSQRLDAE